MTDKDSQKPLESREITNENEVVQPDLVYKKLLKAIEGAEHSPKDHYVINGTTGMNESEYVLNLKNAPYTYHIEERGQVSSEAEFEDPLDVAVFFYAKLFGVPGFRSKYRELGGNFSATSSETEYSDAFVRIMDNLNVPRTSYALSESELTDTSVKMYVIPYENKWKAHSLHSLGTGVFTSYADALDFAYWTIDNSLYRLINEST